MSWQRITPLPWQPPLTLAATYAGADMALLYSGLQEARSGRYSYLLLEPLKTLEGADWASLPTPKAGDDDLPHWVGYLGYGLREGAQRGSASPIALPDFRLTRYAHLLQFDHAQQQLTHFSTGSRALPAPQSATQQGAEVLNIHSNFTRARYADAVAQTIAHIHAGDFYQANITRKFFGQFAQTPDAWRIYEKLCTASPAPYSAFLRHGTQAILSSSPECFLSIDGQGTITTRPIKGSARRSADAAEDAAIRTELKSSTKNHAENLMIVDLMRNDLSRVSVPQTVQVTEQSGLYSYATIHHLISTIQSQKLPAATASEVVQACFPPGSMTGAPKIAAIRWCEQMEQMERGVYSGAIGWFGAAHRCDLSVVIRTLILEEDRFEFQVGGGIVADSTPDDEWRETLVKARGILAALGLKEEDLARL